MTNVFAEASRRKIRFNTPKGQPAGGLTTEDLWSLHLETLDFMAQDAAKVIEEAPKSTLIRKAGQGAESKNVVENRIRYEVIAYIMNVRQDEQEAAAKRVAENALISTEKELAAEALLRKRANKFEEMSEEDLLKVLNK